MCDRIINQRWKGRARLRDPSLRFLYIIKYVCECVRVRTTYTCTRGSDNHIIDEGLFLKTRAPYKMYNIGGGRQLLCVRAASEGRPTNPAFNRRTDPPPCAHRLDPAVRPTVTSIRGRLTHSRIVYQDSTMGWFRGLRDRGGIMQRRLRESSSRLCNLYYTNARASFLLSFFISIPHTWHEIVHIPLHDNGRLQSYYTYVYIHSFWVFIHIIIISKYRHKYYTKYA